MRFLKFKFIIGVSIGIYIIGMLASNASADGVNLGVYPPIIQIIATPPAKIESEVTIQNLENQSINVSIELRPFTASKKENGEVRYLNKNEPFGADPLLLQRIEIVENGKIIKETVLGPKQKKTLKINITIPKESPLSDYYFSILFISKSYQYDQISQSEKEPKQSGSFMQVGISTNILLSVGPKGIAKGTIEEFSSPLFMEKGPVPFTVRINNKSEHSVAPKGNILIKNFFGQLIGNIELAQVNILAGTIRSIPDIEHIINLKTQKEMLSMDHPKAFWTEYFLLGPYTATLTTSLTDNGPIYSRTIYFFGFPIQGVIGILMSVIIVFWLKQRINYHKKNKPNT
ncbi:hypothetical protein LBMAG33_7030 [Candidatus Levyibacteriota bacterium]|nr:DUF916 domain-containing protein [Candidatus Levybacteria bacterium]MSU26082.1 DUF916 domain-containing protein [Candidatus Levybacteria bacterium]GDX62393.1 hypothetical protein LBMAG33_7030 [Candidatus Levybacteria bacterium]